MKLFYVGSAVLGGAGGNGCGAKIIFSQFDTIILTFVYHFFGDEID